MDFTKYVKLNEAFAPITSLLSVEQNKDLLMRKGVTKNSRLEKITKEEAMRDNEHLILFSHYNITTTEKGKVKFEKPAENDTWEKRKHLQLFVPWEKRDKATKKREALKKKTYVSILIGYKHGNEFEVWRQNDAAGAEAGANKSCDTLKCLYDNSTYIYRVIMPEKEMILRKFRQEHPGRHEVKTTISNYIYKLYIIKLISLLEKSMKWQMRYNLEKIKPSKSKTLKTDFSSSLYNEAQYLIIKKLNEIKKNPKGIKKEEIDEWISNIVSNQISLQ